MLLLWSNQFSQPDSILPTRNLVLGGSIRIGEDRLILIGIALVLGSCCGPSTADCCSALRRRPSQRTVASLPSPAGHQLGSSSRTI